MTDIGVDITKLLVGLCYESKILYLSLYAFLIS